MGEEEEEAPLLLISQGKLLERHLIYRVPGNQSRTLNIPVLRNKRVIGSGYGWLVLVGPDTTDCCLLNSRSMDVIDLPRLERASEYKECILTKPPTDRDCHVLLNAGFIQSYCRIGDEHFARMSYFEERQLCYILAMVSFHGQIYGLMNIANQTSDHQFGTIHMNLAKKSREFRPIQLKVDDDRDWTIPDSYGGYIWLIESPQSCGMELLMVQMTYLDGFDFRIFKIDTNRKQCREVMNIGERTIFLSRNGRCGYCCSFTGVKPNSIYYTNTPKDNDQNLYVFDLEDRSITMQLPSRAVGYESYTTWVQNTNLFTSY